MNEKRLQFGEALDYHIGISAICLDDMPAVCAAKSIAIGSQVTGRTKPMNELSCVRKKSISGGGLKTERSETRWKRC
jgi:hypothetical protein